MDPAETPEIAIDARGLRKRFAGGFTLEVDELQVPAAGLYGVIGGNGAGKTTLLRLLTGLLPPEEGTIRCFGEEVVAGREGLGVRRRLVYLSQTPVLFRGTVLRNVLYGLRVRGVPRSEAHERAAAALAEVRMTGFAGREANRLSGGEAQRVALARAICLDPACLLLDEPTSHLDTEHIEIIEKCLLSRNAGKQTVILFTTHDLDQAERLSQNLVRLERGRIVSSDGHS